MAVTKNPPSFSQRDDIFSFFLESPSLLLFPLCVFTMILQGYLDSPLHDNAIFLVAIASLRLRTLIGQYVSEVSLSLADHFTMLNGATKNNISI